MVEDWKNYEREIAGYKFRPVSMATLALLYNINSPFVMGGVVDAVDYCVFAWMHNAPIMDVVTGIKSGSYIQDAVLWGSEVPPIIFSNYCPHTLKALSKDLSRVFIDKNTGYIPFPLPSACKRSWWQRVIIIGKRLLKIG